MRTFCKKSLCIKVIDHGIDIPNTEKTVFDRFYQVDKSHNDKYYYGLGLSIALNIILLHKGTLKVKVTGRAAPYFVLPCPLIEK